MHPSLFAYWHTLDHKDERVPGGPTANITLSPPMQGMIVTPHTGQDCIDCSDIAYWLLIEAYISTAEN